MSRLKQFFEKAKDVTYRITKAAGAKVPEARRAALPLALAANMGLAGCATTLPIQEPSLNIANSSVSLLEEVQLNSAQLSKITGMPVAYLNNDKGTEQLIEQLDKNLDSFIRLNHKYDPQKTMERTKTDTPEEALETQLKADKTDLIRGVLFRASAGGMLSVKGMDADGNRNCLILDTGTLPDKKTIASYYAGIPKSYLGDIPGTDTAWRNFVLLHEARHCAQEIDMDTLHGETDADLEAINVMREAGVDKEVLHTFISIRSISPLFLRQTSAHTHSVGINLERHKLGLEKLSVYEAGTAYREVQSALKKAFGSRVSSFSLEKTIPQLYDLALNPDYKEMREAMSDNGQIALRLSVDAIEQVSPSLDILARAATDNLTLGQTIMNLNQKQEIKTLQERYKRSISSNKR